MNSSDYAKMPYVLNLNRVKRAYKGGALLDAWQGLDHCSDGNWSEEFLVSTVEVSNEKKAAQEGLSTTTLPTGQTITLKDLIRKDPVAFLGQTYAPAQDVCVSARVGDTIVRHVLQCHPDTDFARRELGFPNGKAEAWYILQTRQIDGRQPCLYVGFKPGVTREKWTELFNKQDIDGMLECMHCIPVYQGHTYFVDAGMPHCLGPGSMFLEVHEPCDYTFRVEKNYLPDHVFSDYEMNYGLGNEKLMEVFHYDTYTEEEILRKCVLQPAVLASEPGARVESIVSYQQAKRFKVEKYTFTRPVKTHPFQGHQIAITVQGDCVFCANGQEVFAPQGRGVFLPADRGEVTLRPAREQETVVLVCSPPPAPFSPGEIFRDPIQVGVLVRDLDACLEKLEKVFGMGPFRIADYPPAQTAPMRLYHGEGGDFQAKFCFFHLGNIELELIQPLGGQSIWEDFLRKRGSGIHHLKFLVPEHSAVRAHMQKNGYDVSQAGEGVGPNKHRIWAFYPTYDDIGFDVEVMND